MRATHLSTVFVRASLLLSQDMRDSIEVGLKRANGVSQHAISAGGSKRRKMFGIDGFAQSAHSSASDNSASLHHAAQVGSLVRQWYCTLSFRVFPMVAHWTGLVFMYLFHFTFARSVCSNTHSQALLARRMEFDCSRVDHHGAMHSQVCAAK